MLAACQTKYLSRQQKINTMKNLILSLLLLVSLTVFVQAQKISEWREANRTGVSAETGLLTSWPADGPALLWCNTELSKGYANVSFGNNFIYTTGTIDSVDVLYALDMSGKLLWHTVIGRAWNESFPESRSTPTVEGNQVYTSSGYGDLACIDGISGKIICSLTPML